MRQNKVSGEIAWYILKFIFPMLHLQHHAFPLFYSLSLPFEQFVAKGIAGYQ